MQAHQSCSCVLEAAGRKATAEPPKPGRCHLFEAAVAYEATETKTKQTHTDTCEKGCVLRCRISVLVKQRPQNATTTKQTDRHTDRQTNIDNYTDKPTQTTTQTTTQTNKRTKERAHYSLSLHPHPLFRTLRASRDLLISAPSIRL